MHLNKETLGQEELESRETYDNFANLSAQMVKHFRLTSRVGEMLKEAVHRQEQRSESGHFLAPSTSYSSGMSSAGTSASGSARGYTSGRKHDGHFSTEEEESDPNEPRYCICNQVSYGEMVACDNKDVISAIYCSYQFLFYFIFSVPL